MTFMMYNLVITNNSDNRFKSIGFYTEDSSGDVLNADNSFIESGEKFTMTIESNKFNLYAIDGYDNKLISQKFDLEFETNKATVYKISIEKDSSGSIEFFISE